ncbi:phosphotransferase [Paeniglutamicibacter cryotolerans]|nr:phosphotransferase [Paeniglutamicibacter cryotolerans]
MELAAIATAAVPGLAPTGVAGVPDGGDDFDSVLIVDAQKNRWRVRSPRHEEASMRLEAELTALRTFSPNLRASLPFQLPSVAGTVRQGSLRTFVYHHLPGGYYDLDSLVGLGSKTAADIGTVMAAIHALPDTVVERSDLPTYTADLIRQRRLNELDQSATTGMIPSRLLRRWEHALEDVALWRFNTTVVHGDLHEDQLLLEDGKVVAVTGWTDLHVGDPADDFAWLAAVSDQSFADTALEAYVRVRGDKADPHIMRRAALAAEFALAQWLAKAIGSGDPARIAEAKGMLTDLDEDIAEHGGQPISVVEPPRPPRTEAPTMRAAEPAAAPQPALEPQDEDEPEDEADEPTPQPVPVKPVALVDPGPATDAIPLIRRALQSESTADDRDTAVDAEPSTSAIPLLEAKRLAEEPPEAKGTDSDEGPQPA